MDDVQDLDFNSSELEFTSDEEPPPAHRKIGQASIEKIIADSAKDRVSSKKTVKKLQLNRRAPMSDYSTSLWVTRFNTYREQTLRQSPDTPFTGQDLIRFMDSMIGKIQPRMNKPAPSLTVVYTGYKLILQYGIFRWSAADGFSITANDAARFKSFTIQAVKEKRLLRGVWSEKTWTGFVTVSRLIRVFLDHFVRVGTGSFDLVVARCLSVVLISSLGCRSGDVSQSNMYSGVEYLQYKHIRLFLEDGVQGAGRAPQFQDLRAVVTLEFCKNHKDEPGEEQVRYLRPLDVQSVHVCPVALLLVHTLRNGLVHGTTLAQVLAHAAARTDLHVEWKYPTRPVLAAFARGPGRCDLDTSARTSQVLETIKMMGLVSGMLSRAYGHSLRIGAIRDHAHTSRRQGKKGGGGSEAAPPLPSADENRRFAGHNHNSMQRGVTDKYIGDMAHDFYNERAEAGGARHRREPTFAVGGGGEAYWDMVQKPPRADEVQAYVDEHKNGRDPASLTFAERRTMVAHVRRSRVKALDAEPARSWTASKTTTAAGEEQGLPPPPSVPQKQKAPPPPQLSRSRATRAMPTVAEPPPARPTTNKSHAGSRGDDDGDDDYDGDDLDDLDLVEAGLQVGPTGVPATPGPRRSGRVAAAAAASGEDPHFLSKIDPALLDEEELASLTVTDGHLEALRDVIILDGGAGAQGPAGKGDEGVFEDNMQTFVDSVASGGPATKSNDDIEEAARVLLSHDDDEDEEKGPGDQTASDSHAGWIDGYARHNVVNNQRFAREWARSSKADGQASFEESIGHHSVRGNSRDEPTPYVFHCRRTEGCDFTTIQKSSLDAHELSCGPESVERAKAKAKAKEEVEEEVEEEAEGDTTTTTTILRCTRPGCTFKTSKGKKVLNRHIKDTHDYIPQECDQCDDGVVYQTSSQLNYHKRKVHVRVWPSACLFPGCPSTVEFKTSGTLIRHLRVEHGLTTPTAYTPYLPPLPEKEVWVSQKCVMDTCSSEISFGQKKHMVAHLRNVHKMDLAQANELVNREARLETVVPKPAILGPKPGGINNNGSSSSNSNVKKRGNQQASLTAPGKENHPPPAAALDGVQEQHGAPRIAGAAEPKLKKPRVKKG